MNCNDIRELLHRRFDDGLDLSRGLDDHLDACAACREELEHLSGLREGLFDLPFDVPDVQLAARVKEAVLSERRARLRPAVLAAGIAALLVAASIVNWCVPVYPAALSGWEKLAQRLPDPEWLEPGPPIRTQFEAAWTQGWERIRSFRGFSPMGTWVALALTVVFVVAFNGVEAARLRSRPSGAPQPPHASH